MSPAVPDFHHRNDNEQEHTMNETTGYADDDRPPTWGLLDEMWNRIERDVRREAIQKGLDDLVAVWEQMIDASTQVHTAATDAGFTPESAEEIALGFVLKITAGATGA